MLIAPEKICFGRWQLDAQRRTLLADGTPVALNGRAFDLLELLVARRGQAVTRDELIAHVWQDVTVGENNLTVQMSHLRKVLGDDSGMILTVPRGYKFAGEVDPPVRARLADADEQSPLPNTSSGAASQAFAGPRFGSWSLRAAAFVAVLILALGCASLFWSSAPVAPRLSIAVLPFRNLSADPAQDYLADELTDDLTTDLAHIPRSTVIARESADAWRGRAAPIQQISHALRVRYIVEGSLRQEDGQYHVNAQLVDGNTGAHLWAARLDAPKGRIGDVRDVIVRRLATALGFQLEQIENFRSLKDRPSDPDALDLFFQARAILDHDVSLPGLEHAQRLLEKATRMEPDFAEAFAELGATLLKKIADMDDPNSAEDEQEAHQDIALALSLTPRSALGLASRSRELATNGDCDKAIASANEAIAIEQSNIEAELVLAKCLMSLGQLDQAALHLQHIIDLTPNSPQNVGRFLELGYINLVQGKLDAGIDFLRKVSAQVGSEVATESLGVAEDTQLLLLAAAEMKGRKAQAQQILKEYEALWPHRSVWRLRSYFSKYIISTDGGKRLLDAMAKAGLPYFEDEHMTAQEEKAVCSGGDFDITPGSLIGGQTFDTDRLVSAVRSVSKPLIIDIGRGAAAPPGSIWYNENDTKVSSETFAEQIAKESAHTDATRTIVLMGDGVFGCGAYRTAEALVRQGWRNIVWYRGGEEAWVSHGQTYSDVRP